MSPIYLHQFRILVHIHSCQGEYICLFNVISLLILEMGRPWETILLCIIFISEKFHIMIILIMSTVVIAYCFVS